MLLRPVPCRKELMASKGPPFYLARRLVLEERGIVEPWETTVLAHMRQQGIGRAAASDLADRDFGISEEEISARIPDAVARNNTHRAGVMAVKRREREEADDRRKREATEIAMAHRDGKLVIQAAVYDEAEESLRRKRNQYWRKKKDQRAGVDDYDAIRWVADVFADDDVTRADAPSDMAWSLLTFARSTPANTATFWSQLFRSIALPKRTEIEEMQRSRAGMEHITEAIEEARLAFRSATGREPSNG